ncbi:MAG TPA: efflux RND transporter periplasmic adaptor subunit [Thermoanaerobaculia bacterium]|nr:efflux RND transporter periplasmic adaptor subunit [Thermoanaerobaculia bacterium]
MNLKNIALLLPLIAIVFVSCARPEEMTASAAPKSAAPLSVATVTAAPEAVAQQLALTGTLEANEESAVAANTSGQVTRIFVERGSYVTKGAPLIQLDTRKASLSATEAQAQLESARTQKQLADSECERNRRLFERHVITVEEYEKITASCKAENQSLAAAESRQRQAVVTVADATVRAPFSGIVSERFVNVGEYVTTSTKVVHLVESDPVRVELAAGERDASAIRVGQTLTFSVKGRPGKTYEATVRYVAPALRASTRDLVFEAVAPNASGELKPGMFATAKLDTGSQTLVVVPRSALRTDGQTAHAFVVTNGRLEERIVHVARELGDRVAVASGIASGERVAIGIDDRFKDGLAVAE